ncbi:MAG: 2-hydroxyacid dehydrogenase [Tunicatimonas sp.]
MKVAFFSTKSYDQEFMDQANAAHQHQISYFDSALTTQTAVLAQDHPAVCLFVNDAADAAVLEQLHDLGVKLIALRSMGFNNVDLKKAKALEMPVVRVPAYSPYAVAEHALAMILTLNRKTHLAYARVRNGNFSLEHLMGFDLRGRTVGVVGTGKIGRVFSRMVRALGCSVVAYDPRPDEDFGQEDGIEYVSLPELFSRARIISLHCPLTDETRHLISADAIKQMQPEVMLINTSRGALVDTAAVIKGLKSRKVGYFGLDVYEQEEDLFFEDLSGAIIQDDQITRLMTFPNVLITSHQAFFTRDAMTQIAETTLQNIADFAQGDELKNQVLPR